MTNRQHNIGMFMTHAALQIANVGYGFVEGDVVRDVSNEESRLYVGDNGSIVIEQQITLAVGEEGERIFGLRNGVTLIVPPSFTLEAIFTRS
jgi:hypothetical protein